MGHDKWEMGMDADGSCTRCRRARQKRWFARKKGSRRPVPVPGLLGVRRALGVTQSELARRMGTYPTSVWLWETGRTAPNLVSRAKICLALGVDERQLVDRTIASFPPRTKGPRGKLTAEQAEEIRMSGEQTKALAERYGVSKASIRNVRAGKTWKNAGLVGTR